MKAFAPSAIGIAAIAFAGCPRPPDPNTVALSGAVQKGPFVLGSSMLVSALDTSGNPTGAVFPTQTMNDLGEFAVEAELAGFIAIEGVGFYYNEVTAQLSAAPLTLRAFHDVAGAATATAYVNVLTHLAYPRVLALVTIGLGAADAVAQAELEVRAALAIGPLAFDPAAGAITMNLLGGDSDANAYLFAVSAVVAEAAVLEAGAGGPIDATLQESLNAIAMDLAGDGAIDPVITAALDVAEIALDPALVMADLAARLADVGSTATVPDLDRVIDTDQDDVANGPDNCRLIWNLDQADADADGIGDACDCGNGIVDPGEACDDANAVSADGCEADCTVTVFAREPMNGSYVGSMYAPGTRRPTFSWAPAPGTGYELDYSTDPTFATGVTTEIVAGTTTFTPAVDLLGAMTPPVGARYWWRVRACDAGGTCAAYGPAWYVNVGRDRRDFNGDGYADVVVGSPAADYGGTDTGRVSVYFGNPGASLETTADLQIDGTIPNMGSGFGTAVASAGDVNADGFADLLVGAPWENNVGNAYLYFGGDGAAFDSTADAFFPGAPLDYFFGLSVASGDLNADGYDDVAIGAPGIDGADGGRVYVYLGGPGVFDTTPTSILYEGNTLGQLGSSVSAGDANGDGYADLFVGLYRCGTVCGLPVPPPGRAHLYLGGPGSTFNALMDVFVASMASDDGWGSAVGAAGDVDADGFSELLLGVPRASITAAADGQAHVFFGAWSGLDPAPVTAQGALAGQWLGFTVAAAGDLNGDGFADIAIASYDGLAIPGTVDVLFGGPRVAFDVTAEATLTGNGTDGFAYAVRAAGDVNGDGFGDLLVAAPTLGAVELFYGGAGSTFDPSADAQLTGADGFGLAIE